MEDKQKNITEILTRWRDGDEQALDELAPLVMHDLRVLARSTLRGPEAHGIQATELVNEFYSVVADTDKKPTHVWASRKQFFAFASKAMRNLMLTSLRKQNTIKRGGDQIRVSLDEVLNHNHDPQELIQIGEAVEELEQMDPLQGRIVDLVFFVGLTQQEAADALEITVFKLRREWRMARMWLQQSLTQP